MIYLHANRCTAPRRPLYTTIFDLSWCARGALVVRELSQPGILAPPLHYGAQICLGMARSWPQPYLPLLLGSRVKHGARFRLVGHFLLLLLVIFDRNDMELQDN